MRNLADQRVRLAREPDSVLAVEAAVEVSDALGFVERGEGRAPGAGSEPTDGGFWSGP
ncbi:hypothetical protein ACWCQW_47090 [Streptomyces mirabilis]